VIEALHLGEKKFSGHRTGCQHCEMMEAMAGGVPSGKAGLMSFCIALAIGIVPTEFCPGLLR